MIASMVLKLWRARILVARSKTAVVKAALTTSALLIKLLERLQLTLVVLPNRYDAVFHAIHLADCNLVLVRVNGGETICSASLKWTDVIEVVNENDAVAVDQHRRSRVDVNYSSWASWTKNTVDALIARTDVRDFGVDFLKAWSQGPDQA